MEVPKKIYLSQIENGTYYYTEGIPFERNYIEYIRKDSFIEKACKWLRNNSHNYANNALGKEYLVNDFVNYMKGE